jgi:diguanylate cyclase (GGDEF)-like protein
MTVPVAARRRPRFADRDALGRRRAREPRRGREPDEGLALLDPLMGLPNRRAFDARLAEEVARAERTGRRNCVVLLDLDHFQLVNDKHGHPVGDAVLVEAGRRLQTAARQGDVVVRVGGEEFD